MSKFLSYVMLIFFIDLGMFFVGYPPSVIELWQIVQGAGIWALIGVLLALGLGTGIMIFGSGIQSTEFTVFSVITGALLLLATAPIGFFAEASIPIYFKLFLGTGLSLTYILAGLEWYRSGQ